ncbi:helix-turn-helix domain-containing protein [Nocardia miyunensis]|uniref:helix-turn-helix domain-containing protein n=1 Tax=Nocardia miyunensis TaxID=282684 RepID=UPI0009FD52C5|nr:helix-turn-helix transcriptional regulator [Nocardia miyunensis]
MTIEATTVPRRLLARRLVELREAANLSRDAAAELAEIGRQTLWRLENGRTSEVKKPTIRALCRVYEVEGEDLDNLLWLADESRKDGWWQSYSSAIFLNRDLFMSLEAAASRITSFQLTLIPGLAQTADYRRAMARDYLPAVSGEQFEQHLEVLDIRQARLSNSKDPLELEVLISEATLRHRIGGASVMRSQVHHLYELSKLPNISVRIVPLTVEGFLGLQTGSFVMLEFPKHLNPSLVQPPVVFIESYSGALYLDKPAEIELYQKALAAIEAAALDEPHSRELLQQIEEEYAA